jgi:hypothetical protein
VGAKTEAQMSRLDQLLLLLTIYPIVLSLFLWSDDK